MKIVAVSLIFLLSSVSVFAQQHTINIDHGRMTVSKALRIIEKQTELRVAFRTDMDTLRIVELPSGRVKLEDLLDTLLKGTNQSYAIQDGFVSIKKIEPVEKLPQAAANTPKIEAFVSQPQTYSTIVQSTTAPKPTNNAPKLAIKSNLLYDATTTINIGGEFKVGELYTIDIPVNFNNWTFSENKKFKNFLVQPELRRWFCEPFRGHFVGTHLFMGYYNIGGIEMPLGLFPKVKDHRYEGNFFGAGVSYGYQWMLNDRLNLEATFGLGYAHVKYKEFECRECGFDTGKGTKNYFGPTKMGLSLIYIIK